MVDAPALLDEAVDILGELVELRRAIHAEPEVGLVLPMTQQKVLGALDGLGLEVARGAALSSVVATLRGASPGPTVLLRADMDALRLQEATGLAYASRHEQAMHACGHDAHTAMLVGAARLLVRRRHTLAGNVVFFFQPGEEGCHGARLAIEEGLLDAPVSPDWAFALHVAPDLPAGTVATRAGAIMGESTTLRFRVKGRGAHGARPHHSIDPLPAACHAVLALQTLMAREIDPARPAVLSVTGLRTSTMLTNVIPDVVEGVATLRTFASGEADRLSLRARQIIELSALALRASADVEVTPFYPLTINDDEMANCVLGVAGRLAGAALVTELDAPSAGSEDFGYILERVPGALAFLGVGEGEGEPMELHDPRLRIDEEALATGAALHAGVALALLARDERHQP